MNKKFYLTLINALGAVHVTERKEKEDPKVIELSKYIIPFLILYDIKYTELENSCVQVCFEELKRFSINNWNDFFTLAGWGSVNEKE